MLACEWDPRVTSLAQDPTTHHLGEESGYLTGNGRPLGRIHSLISFGTRLQRARPPLPPLSENNLGHVPSSATHFPPHLSRRGRWKCLGPRAGSTHPSAVWPGQPSYWPFPALTPGRSQWRAVISCLSFEAVPVLGTVYGYLHRYVVGPTLSIVVIGRASRALGTLLLLLLAATACFLEAIALVWQSAPRVLGAPQWQPLSPRLPLHLAGWLSSYDREWLVSL